MPTPSPLRHLAAWGLDLLLIAVLLTALRPLLPATGPSLIHVVAVWGAFELLTWRLAAPSFGYYAMGVVRDELRRRVLERDLLVRAHWLILFVAVFQVALAAGILIRVLDPEGLFYLAGVRLAPPSGQLLWFGLGLAGLLGAIGLFRCKRYGPPLVLLLQLFVVFNDLASLPLLRESVAREASSAAFADYFQIYLTCNILYLVWMVALFALLRRRFVFRGLF